MLLLPAFAVLKSFLGCKNDFSKKRHFKLSIKLSDPSFDPFSFWDGICRLASAGLHTRRIDGKSIAMLLVGSIDPLEVNLINTKIQEK